MNEEQYQKARKYFKDIVDNSGCNKIVSPKSSPEYIRATIESEEAVQTLLDLLLAIKTYELTKLKKAEKARTEKVKRIIASAQTFLSTINQN